MKRVRLGRTGIEVSKLGIGTGTAHPSGHCAQALMSRTELAGILLYAHEQGINFWDTALQYETHTHVREALRSLRRDQVVLTTKLISSRHRETADMLHTALTELGVDYVDVCLVHGVITEHELESRRGALDALLAAKEAGKIRAVGISSHGLGGLRAAAKIPEIDLVYARINFAGYCMDPADPGLCDRLISVPWLKKVGQALVPKRIISALRSTAGDAGPVSEKNRRKVTEILASIHSRAKGVVGMKVLAAGHLREQSEEAINYVQGLLFVDAFVIGMKSKEEVARNCRLVEKDV